jgi:hypothetical protein
MLKTIDECVEYSNKIVRDLLDYSSQIKLDKIMITPLQEIGLQGFSLDLVEQQQLAVHCCCSFKQ